MTQGEEKKKTRMKDDKRENKKACGGAELPQTAGGRDTMKLVSSSDSSKEDGELPASKKDFPALFSLIVQRHEGETCGGQFHGEGVAWFKGGHTYKGMFAKGLMDGRGVFTHASGLKYEGELVCNMPMGRGTYTWADGSSYEGEVYNGIRHGTGTYICAKSGVVYKGEWERGKRHGKGAVYYDQDQTSWYKGDWVKNNREGQGVRCYPSGNIYSGEWKSNLRHGEGTMRWLKLGQQYVGMWQNGVQHGRGTQVWMLRRVDGSQYSQSNQYTGEFVQGQRHGQGAFYYAGGEIYEGEWKNNKKHGKDGRVFEGEFVDDRMMTQSLDGNRTPVHLCDSDSSILGPDMALSIKCLLDMIPERERNTERKQVEFMVLMHGVELRSVYSFYSRLGHAHSPNNVFLLTRLQLWRLLKDCNIHHHDITLTQIDHFIREDAAPAEIHSPFTAMLFRKLLSCLVVVAYHIYHKDMVSQKNLLAACFSKLMTDNILPNAKNVKGFLFKQPGFTVVSVNYLNKCWEIYQAYCKVNAAPRDDQTMTCRHMLWMFKDLHLLDNNLTTERLLEIITAESRDPSNLSSNVDLEITFLEFFEVLLSSAEVKCQRVSEGQLLSNPDAGARRDVAEVAAPVNSPIPPEISSPKSEETEKSSDTLELSTVQDMESQEDVKTKLTEDPQFEEHRGETKCVQTRGMEAKDCKLELWIQTIHQFFNHFFFPAFEHYQLVSRNTKEEKLRQEAQRRIALAKAQQRSR
ncbi:radial spoke head 10 homolog B isoform X2 [Morone saxatilis]|uniref:radial spoke head 10 homolog B isoform X2 n=1 Tax=Morone saxatilis TaxID=34816 RepID=UPI0015E2415A|nr:radial spoke head 10 homolog B isoform X2 [Morone saxatilis]